MTDSNTFNAWVCEGKGKPLVEMQLELKPWDEDSVELKITHCGICGSDTHTLGKDNNKHVNPIRTLNIVLSQTLVGSLQITHVLLDTKLLVLSQE
ncbi:hypothetical protein G6F57_009556 [Rhizopus arrhizus]|uniref:Uncharacterized protein n=1 Tax=Rhizopus oryzae TaxID=64495 RepID=A0A9P6XIB1_RHIOR|nr:hypothetical protein G6F23_014921 [Rhizopus arrhizus]KAG0767024.1 hypothetical protein G6F24_003142 [Rhizopus arrhizus]KAG0784962.1 hypothetical protein G6F21_009570 [Rhizopus arrhizus]KAG0799052.1 hypothetical protein G6F22_003611 [Rhizopus arrhizus]KAG0819196.1 hypothetical protein G6F20_000943 [Rhizopus arrhizus]